MYAFAHYRAGYTIYANYHLEFTHKKLNKEFLSSIVEQNRSLGGPDEKIAVFLDEFDMYIDSRTSMSKENLAIGYFIKQIRKKNCLLFYATQMRHTVDKRLRSLTRKEILVNDKDLQITTSGGKVIKRKIVYNKIFFKKKLIKHKRFFADPYFKLYNTKELITD